MIKKISSYESYSEGFDDIVSELRRVRKLKYEVSLAFTVTFADSPKYTGTNKSGREVQLFRDRGIRLSLFEAQAKAEDGLIPALREYVRRRTGVWNPEPIEKVELHIFRAP